MWFASVNVTATSLMCGVPFIVTRWFDHSFKSRHLTLSITWICFNYLQSRRCPIFKESFLSAWWHSSALKPGGLRISVRNLSKTMYWAGRTNFMASSLLSYNLYGFFSPALRKGTSLFFFFFFLLKLLIWMNSVCESQMELLVWHSRWRKTRRETEYCFDVACSYNHGNCPSGYFRRSRLSVYLLYFVFVMWWISCGHSVKSFCFPVFFHPSCSVVTTSHTFGPIMSTALSLLGDRMRFNA